MQYPLIVNLILEKDGQILFLYRENTSSFAHSYSLPSGKVEKGQSLKDNLIREAKEELGIYLEPDDLTLCLVMPARYESAGDIIEDIGFYFKAHRYSGTLQNAEPHKHSHIKWVDVDNLPDKTLSFVRTALHAYKNGQTYIEMGYGEGNLAS
jgi:8-oxo-dGTP diphosphatase